MGYEVNTEGFRPPTASIEAVVKWPKPETIQDLRRFIDMINYFRACTSHAAETKAPQTNFFRNAKKKEMSKIPWNDEVLEAFQWTKNSLVVATRTIFLSSTASLMLKHFEHMIEGCEFVVRTDHKPLVSLLAQRPEKSSPR